IWGMGFYLNLDPRNSGYVLIGNGAVVELIAVSADIGAVIADDAERSVAVMQGAASLLGNLGAVVQGVGQVGEGYTVEALADIVHSIPALLYYTGATARCAATLTTLSMDLYAI